MHNLLTMTICLYWSAHVLVQPTFHILVKYKWVLPSRRTNSGALLFYALSNMNLMRKGVWQHPLVLTDPKSRVSGQKYIIKHVPNPHTASLFSSVSWGNGSILRILNGTSQRKHPRELAAHVQVKYQSNECARSVLALDAVEQHQHDSTASLKRYYQTLTIVGKLYDTNGAKKKRDFDRGHAEAK